MNRMRPSLSDQARSDRGNRRAITSFVLALIPLATLPFALFFDSDAFDAFILFSPLLGLVGLIFGVSAWVLGQRALRDDFLYPAPLQRTGLARAGWILGILETLILGCGSTAFGLYAFAVMYGM